MLTALMLGAIIAGASVFRISSLEKESAAHQKASELAEERLRHLSQQLVSSQEQERKALSRELHDEIGQLLTALRMELGNLERGRGDAGWGNRSAPGSGQEAGGKHAADHARYRHGIAAGHAGRAGAGSRIGMAGAGVFQALSHAHSIGSGWGPARCPGSSPHLSLSHRAGRAHQLRAPCASQEHSCEVGGFQRQAGGAGGGRWRGVRSA